MVSLFKLSLGYLIEVRPGAVGEILHALGDLNRCIFHVTKIEMTWRGAII